MLNATRPCVNDTAVARTVIWSLTFSKLKAMDGKNISPNESQRHEFHNNPFITEQNTMYSIFHLQEYFLMRYFFQYPHNYNLLHSSLTKRKFITLLIKQILLPLKSILHWVTYNR